jgi:hypothetical protein
LIGLGLLGLILCFVLGPEPLVSSPSKNILAKGRGQGKKKASRKKRTPPPKHVQLAQTLERRFRKLAPDEMVAQIDEALEKTPKLASELPRLLSSIIIHAEKKGDRRTLMECWERLAKLKPTFSSKRLKFFDTAVSVSARTLLGAGQEDDFLRMAEIALKKVPDTLAARYLKGELWARTGRKGKCPRKLYRIVHRPGVKVILDGRLEEGVYGGLKALPGPFYAQSAKKFKGHKIAGEGFRGTLFHDGAHLYVGVQVVDSSLSKLYTGALPAPEGRDVWADTFDFLFDPARHLGDYRQVVLFSRKRGQSLAYKGGEIFGGRWSFGKQIISEDDPVHQRIEVGTAFINPTTYSIEAKVPLDLLYADGRVSGRLMSGTLRHMQQVDKAAAAGVKPRTTYRSISWSNMSFGISLHQYDYFEFE